MAVYHRTKRLRIYGKKPEVTQLFGGRYAITVRCVAKNDTEAWYNQNKDQIFADFGTLYNAHMAVDGISARTGETYSDMVLTSVGSSYTQTGDYVITFEYQTLTDSFVQESADKVDQELNGLRRVTRPLIAKDGTSYGKTVGTDTISHSAIGYGAETLTLAQAVSGQKSANESGFVRITETWLESGVINRTINEGRGGTGTGKIRTETVEAFNQAPTSTISGVEINVSTSNLEGIDTIKKTFATGAGEVSRNVETRNNGKLTITSVESLGSAGSASGVEIEATTSDQDGYILFRNVFANGNGEVSRNVETRNNGKLTITTIEALGSAGSASGVEIQTTQREESGYTVFRNVFANGVGEVSRKTETRNNGKLIITTVESLGSAGTATGVEIETTQREENGYTLFRNVFAQSDGEIRRTDRPGPSAIPGTTFVTIDSFGTAITPSGTLIDSSETQENGYVRFSRTALQGTIIKTTQTYKDVVFVDVPGEVSCQKINANFDRISDPIGDSGVPLGNSVIIETIPPKRQQVEANVVVNIQDSIPDTTELAFDISGLSCSILNSNTQNSGKVGRAVTLVDSNGNTTTEVGKASSFSVNSNTLEFPRHFVVSGGEEAEAFLGGSQSRQPYINGGQFEFQTAQSGSINRSFAFGSNETDKTSLYKTSGVISKTTRPILTAQDGSVFYEVTTVSATAANLDNGLPIGRELAITE